MGVGSNQVTTEEQKTLFYVCAFHPATLGSSPEHTIYAFINLYWIVSYGKDELDWPIFKITSVYGEICR